MAGSIGAGLYSTISVLASLAVDTITQPWSGSAPRDEFVREWSQARTDKVHTQSPLVAPFVTYITVRFRIQ